MILVRGDVLMNKEEITKKLNYIDDELVKLQNAKAMKYLCNVESYIDYLQKENEKLNHYKLLYQKVKERNDKAIEYMKDFIFEPLLVNEDRKLIMFNDNLRRFEDILKGNNEE